jgi:hypothetical protein
MGDFDRPRGIKQHRSTIVQVDNSAAGCAGFRMRHRTAHLGGRLVLAQALVHDLAEQIVVARPYRPATAFDFRRRLARGRAHAPRRIKERPFARDFCASIPT